MSQPEKSLSSRSLYDRDEAESPRKVRQGSVYEQIQALRNSAAYRGKERKGDFFEKTVNKISGGDDIKDLVGRGGYTSSDDDDERLTDNVKSDTDASYLDTSELETSDGYNSSGPIKSPDELVHAAGKQPPSKAYAFDAMKPRDEDAQKLDDLAFAKDNMTGNKSNEEVLFNNDSNASLSFHDSESVMNLPENPPALFPEMDNDNDIHSEDYTEEEIISTEIEGIEVTEDVEEIEEYIEVTEDGNELEDQVIADQMEDVSSSAGSKHRHDVTNTAVGAELPQYDEKDAEEKKNEEEMTDGVELAAAQPGIVSSSGESLDTIDHKKIMREIPAASQTDLERNEEGNDPPVGLFATAMPDEQAPERFDPENPAEPGPSKQTAASSFDEEAKRSAVKSTRRKMLPYVLCIALLVIIGFIVALVIIGRPDGSDDKALQGVRITDSPTTILQTPAPSPTPAPVSSPTILPPIFLPANPPSPNPTQAPTESPPTVLPPIFTPTPPTPRPTPRPTPQPSPPPTLRPTRAPTATPIAITAAPSLPLDGDNDSCVNAIGPLLPSGSTVNGDFNEASPDEVDRCGDVTTQGPGIWYYVLGTGGEMMAHTCLNGRADTKITIFKGNCEKPECIGGNDNFCGLQSAVSWQSTYRQVYRILVHGPDTPFFFGSFTLSIESRVNDECETAAGPLTIGSGPLVLGNTLEANPNDIDCGQGPNVAPSVWYSIRGTGAEITASVCDGSDYDARISVLVGTCGALSCVIQSEADACSVSFASESFVEYFLMIHGSEGTDSGQFGLRLTTSAIRDNDSCENAIGPLPFDASNIVLGSTAGASAERGVPFCESASTAPGVWYYIIGSGNSIQVSLCSPSTSYDTRLSIYEGTCVGNRLTDLTCITGNDDFCGRQSSVTFQSEVGVTYQILVHGYLLASGDFALTVSET